MPSIKANFWGGLLLLISFIVTAITGLINFFFIPFKQPGAGQGGAFEFLTITKNTWMDIHNWAGIIMIVLALIHIISYWKVLMALGRNVFRKK